MVVMRNLLGAPRRTYLSAPMAEEWSDAAASQRAHITHGSPKPPSLVVNCRTVWRSLDDAKPALRAGIEGARLGAPRIRGTYRFNPH